MKNDESVDKKSDFLLESIKGDLMSLPETILVGNTDLYKLKKQYSELKLEQKQIEFKILIDVEGNLKYKNASQCKVATTELLSTNERYKVITKQIDEVKAKMDDSMIRIEFFNNKFKAARALSRIIGD